MNDEFFEERKEMKRRVLKGFEDAEGNVSDLLSCKNLQPRTRAILRRILENTKELIVTTSYEVTVEVKS